MKKYKHYSSLKKALKKILDSHNKWYSNEGPFASNPNEGLNGDRIYWSLMKSTKGIVFFYSTGAPILFTSV